MFSDKFTNLFGEGKNVKLEGTFLGLDTGILSNQEKFTVHLGLSGGLKHVVVYADKGFSKQLYSLKRGNRIIVYGKTVLIEALE